MKSPIGLTILVCSVLTAACGAPRQTSMRELVFLTRGDCVNTPVMRANLDGALQVLGLPADYQIIDLDTLTSSDVHSGYPTPTALYRSRDLFGMPEPVPPYPEPS